MESQTDEAMFKFIEFLMTSLDIDREKLVIHSGAGVWKCQKYIFFKSLTS